MGGRLEDLAAPVRSLDSLTPVRCWPPITGRWSGLALLEAQQGQARDEEAMTIALLPGIDLAVGIPAAIVIMIRTLPLTGPIATGRLLEAGAALLQAASAGQQHVPVELRRLVQERHVPMRERRGARPGSARIRRQ